MWGYKISTGWPKLYDFVSYGGCGFEGLAPPCVVSCPIVDKYNHMLLLDPNSKENNKGKGREWGKGD